MEEAPDTFSGFQGVPQTRTNKITNEIITN